MLTTADILAHARYYHRASIVISYASFLAFWIGYFVSDREVCDV
jgi:hypothetical protein